MLLTAEGGIDVELSGVGSTSYANFGNHPLAKVVGVATDEVMDLRPHHTVGCQWQPK